MSDDSPFSADKDRFLKDPDYRKRIKEQKQVSAFNLKKKSESTSSSKDAFGLNKKTDDTNSPKKSETSKDKSPTNSTKASSPEASLNDSFRNKSRSSIQHSYSSSQPKISIEEEAARRASDKKETFETKQEETASNSTTQEKPKSTSTQKVDKELRKKTAFSTFLKGVLGFAIIGVAGGILFLFYLMQGLPSIQELENPKTDISSFVKSRDGEVLDKYFTQNRTYVPFENISEHVVNALISIEDHRFHAHWGIDMRRMVGLPYYWLTGRAHGGSTITMQLARNLYRKIGRDFSVIRKLREMLTAVQIEKSYTKREIIEMYLNTVEFSNSSFGIEAAALTHFGKSASDLNPLEAATLIGTLKAVTSYNPRTNTERSLQRRNVVLSAMNTRGFITYQEFQNLKELPISLDYHPPFKTGRKSRYFGEYVRLEMEEWCEENGYDLYRDGLVIYTSIDSRLQRHAEQAVESKLDSLQKIFENEWTSKNGEFMDLYWKKNPLFLDSFIEQTDEYKNGFFGYKTRKQVLDSLKKNKAFVDEVKHRFTKLQASFVSIDPRNGHILAWVGGSNFGNVQFDHVYQSKRQAGSTFKPFVYTVAIDNGYPPYFKLSKYPTKFYDRMGRVWAPSDESISSGPEMVSLRQALARSMNNVTVRLLPVLSGTPKTNKLEDLYPAARKVVSMARSLGIKSSMVANPSIALGTAEVSLLEMVSAYTTYANYGVHIEPFAIQRIEDKEGNILKEYFPEYSREVISPETAYIMLDILRGVVRGVRIGEDSPAIGTGIRLRNLYDVRQDVAAKTGTTQNSADNWFIAMMPHIVMGSWVGGEDRRIRFPENTYIGQGARTALPIVGTFIQKVKEDPNAPWSYDAFEQPKGFVMPEEVVEAPDPSTIKRRVNW